MSFQCQHCNYYLATKQLLKEHIATVHKNVEDKMKKETMCYFFSSATGCSKGDKCEYSHSITTTKKATTAPAKKAGEMKIKSNDLALIPGGGAAKARDDHAFGLMANPGSGGAIAQFPSSVFKGHATTKTITTVSTYNSATRKMEVKQIETIDEVKKVPKRIETQVRKPFQVLILIDVSGSMQVDARFKEAINGARAVINEMNIADDWVGIATFSSRKASSALTEFMDFKQLKSKKSEVELFLNQLERSASFGGATALYDAILECADKFKAYESLPDLQHLLIVATDGADNDSDVKSVDTVNRLLHSKQHEKKLNLHVTILPIEVSEKNVNDLENVLRGQVPLPGGIQRRKLGEIHHCANASVIKDKFATAAKTVFETVRICRSEEKHTSISIGKR